MLIEELYNEDDNDYINKKNNNVSTDAEIDYCSENSDEIEEKTYKKNKENLSKIIVGFDYCIVTFNDNNNSEIKENYY